MRKRAVKQVYDVLQAVHRLERKLKSGAVFDEADRDECIEHLKRARHQLHEVLEHMAASDFRRREAA